MIENLITKKDVAKILSMSVRTVEDYVTQRKIPFIRIGGVTRFRESDIERWLSHKTYKPKKEVFRG